MDVRVGVSACLLGRNVRYDGGHKRDRFVTEDLGKLATLVPVCPEVEVGMGTPRETIRLVRGEGEEVRLIAPASGTDHTEAMSAFARERVAELQALGLDGYVLKSGSPSCGLERVRIYHPNGMPDGGGQGRFAAVLSAAWPELPLEEEGRLHDTFLREQFVTRVFGHARLRAFLARESLRFGDLVAFHSREKLLLLTHEPAAYKRLGQLVARGKELEWEELLARYRGEFLGALAGEARAGRHVNTCQHMLGYFRERLSAESRAEMHQALDDYSQGLLPLAVPLALIRHHARDQGIDYLLQQTYLEPAPKSLKLRVSVD